MKLSFLALIIISLSFALYYTFTIYQETKITLETEKPPERKKTHEEERIPEGEKRQESKRLPDVVIMGVKKSGTITLGRRERERRFSVDYLPLSHPDSFLNHHPNIVRARGENKFFSIDSIYRKGLPHLISTMPSARLTTRDYNCDKTGPISHQTR